MAKRKYFPKTKGELDRLCDDENINLGEIDTSEITDMSTLFRGSERSDFSGIEGWNVSRVTNMRSMFENAKNFNQPLGSWDVGKVTNMERMLDGAVNFNQPLGSWDVGSVENVESMFYNAASFNQPLDSWDVGSVESMKGMFMGSGVKNLPKWYKDRKRT